MFIDAQISAEKLINMFTIIKVECHRIITQSDVREEIMLARIVYYKKNPIPEEEIITVNKVEKALEIARKKLEREIMGFEVEII